MQLSLDLGINNSRNFGFNPAQLFAANEVGVWFDTSDISTLFQDVNAVSPITATGQSCTLMLDKSKNLVLGPNILSTNWTTVAAGASIATNSPAGTIFLFCDGTNQAYVEQSIATEIGVTYRMTMNTGVGNILTIAVGTAQGGGTLANLGAAANVTGYTFVFTATTTTTWIKFVRGAGGSCNVTNITTRKLPGYHAVQSLPASRSIYGIMPKGGIRNVMPTSVFTLMTQQGTPTPTLSGTLGGEDAYVLTDNDTGQWEATIVNITNAVVGRYTFQCRIGKNANPTSAAAARVSFLIGASSVFCGFVINPATGALLSPGVWADRLVSRNVVDGGDHWKVVCVMEFLSGDSLQNVSFFPAHFAVDGVSQASSNVGVNTFAAPQLEVGSVATNYQKVTTKYNVTETGKSSLGILWPDGIDDGMVTPSINFASYTWDGEVRRNFVLGGAQTGNYSTYPNGVLQNGVTSTNVGSGIDPDGIPYALIRYQGTSTGPQHGTGITQANMKVAAVAGQTFTSSMTAALVGGSAANLVGLRIDVAEENSSGIYLTNSSSTLSVAAIDTPHVVTRTLTEATTAFARAGVVLTFATGAVIDVTFKIKGLQFEAGAVKTAWQGTGTDKITVWAGLQKMNDAARAIVFENNVGTQTFALNAPNTSATNFAFVSGGSTISTASAANALFPAPSLAVITGVGDIANDVSQLYVNNVLINSSVVDQGVGNYANFPIYLFRRGGTTLPFGGPFSGLIVRSKATPLSDIANTNAALNNKLGAY